MIITGKQLQKLINATLEEVKNAFTGTNKSDDFRFGAAMLTTKGKVLERLKLFDIFNYPWPKREKE